MERPLTHLTLPPTTSAWYIPGQSREARTIDLRRECAPDSVLQGYAKILEERLADQLLADGVLVRLVELGFSKREYRLSRDHREYLPSSGGLFLADWSALFDFSKKACCVGRSPGTGILHWAIRWRQQGFLQMARFSIGFYSQRNH